MKAAIGQERCRGVHTCVLPGMAVHVVLWMMLVPAAEWVQLQLRAQETAAKAVARISTASLGQHQLRQHDRSLMD